MTFVCKEWLWAFDLQNRIIKKEHLKNRKKHNEVLHVQANLDSTVSIKIDHNMTHKCSIAVYCIKY